MCPPSNKPSPYKYLLFGQPLSTVSSHLYLRVKLDSKLTWTNHITDIASKSLKVLGIIKRTLSSRKPEVKQTAYNMLIRPKLEYSSPYGILTPSHKLKALKEYNTLLPDLLKNYYRWNTNPTKPLNKDVLLNKPQPSTKF